MIQREPTLPCPARDRGDFADTVPAFFRSEAFAEDLAPDCEADPLAHQPGRRVAAWASLPMLLLVTLGLAHE